MTRTLSVLILILVIATTAAADPVVTTGITKVSVSRQANTFTWTLINTTGLGDTTPEWDVLIWSLEPEGFPEPTSWTAPEGWEWTRAGGGVFTLLDASKKYIFGGPAVEPGEQALFTYTIDAPALGEAGLSGKSFVAHVGAVSGFETTGGVKRWNPFETANGRSWFDRSDSGASTPVPEPSGMLALVFALVATLGIRCRRP